MPKPVEESRRAAPSGGSLARLIVKLLLAVGLLGVVVHFIARGGNYASGVPKPSWLVVDSKGVNENLELCGLPAKNQPPVLVNMLYSDDKRAWVEHAANRFAWLCPNIQVALTAMTDIAAANAILEGRQNPVLWVPTSDTAIDYLEAGWQERTGKPLSLASDQPSIVQSPLVWLLWEDRQRVLDAILQRGLSSEGPWARSLCAGLPRDPEITNLEIEDMVPGSWSDEYSPLIPPAPPPPPTRRTTRAQARADQIQPAAGQPAQEPAIPSLEELRSWGRVKLRHTPPTVSGSGMKAVYLLAYDYVLPPPERTMPDLDRAFAYALAEQKHALRQWLRRCQAGLELAPASTRLLTDAMFDLGPSRYDGVVTYEHLVFPFLDQINDHEDTLRKMTVVYPQPTMVNRHPAVLFDPDDPARAEQHEAARRWIAFLLSREMQWSAIEHGFRPGNPDISIRAYSVSKNPFLRLRRFGISFESELLEPPRLDGNAIRELIRIWEDATGRN